MRNNTDDSADNDGVRSIYNVLYHSNYGKCSGNTEEELLAMKSCFDVCIQFELANRNNSIFAAYNPSSLNKRKDRKESL